MIKKILALVGLAMALATTIGAQSLPECYPCTKGGNNGVR